MFISKNDQEVLTQFLKTLTLLYVEDDESIRKPLSQFLQRRVKKLVVAENGMEGLDLFTQQKPDLIVSDVKMPIMTGLEMIQAIREYDNEIPVILTTAFRESDYFLQAIEYDVDEYILKPIDTNLLSRVLLKCAKLLKDRRYANIAKATFESIHSNILITNEHHQIITINPMFAETFGFDLNDVYLKDISILNAGKQDNLFYQDIYNHISDYGFWEGEIWNRTKSGEIQVQWLTIEPSSKNIKQLNYIYILNNLNTKNIEKNHLEYQAYHDHLTRLPNRYLLMDRLNESIAFAERYQKKIAVLFLDLNEFKPVNDEFGHHIGDLLLQQVANRLSDAINIFDTVSRLGDDEFVIILTDIENEESIKEFSKIIYNKIKETFNLYGTEEINLNISTSIGGCIYPDHAKTAEDLIHCADQAMYEAKQNKLEYKIA